MQIETCLRNAFRQGGIGNAMEFSRSTFSKSPERFNTVDMAFSIGKLIPSMVDSLSVYNDWTLALR
ncbi:MAG: hypothetical protein JRH08_14785 [Deltaproteobacteria bacterium]|nr:hypothetical protein [Deltaproteobacteria bacterium]MBW2126903.1 hypothetical protein [Deltaproteobacteria bacterium]